jgi:triosephosphate isomerase
VRVASQNVHWLERGAATGEISPLMVKDTGAGMIEIGHSERRSMFAETDLTVNAKVIAKKTAWMRWCVSVKPAG